MPFPVTQPELGHAAAKSDLSTDLVAAILTDVRASGFAKIASFASHQLLPLCCALGVPRGDIRDSRKVRPLQPQSSGEARSNTLSSRYGTGPFPFHTETAYWFNPARFLVLHCENPGAGLRPTFLADTHSWQLGDQDRWLLENAGWKIKARKPFLSSILNMRTNRQRVRFDRECMAPFTNDANRAQNLLAQQLERCNAITIHWSAYDLLVIDNERMLHARGPTSAPDPDRTLYRVLISEAA